MFRNLDAELSRIGMTKKKLSEVTGIPYKTLINQLSGKTPILNKNMRKIKKAVFPNLSIDYLFDCAEEPKTD